ncbi:hypothetical protein Bca4012_031969 [Brassica carinata]
MFDSAAHMPVQPSKVILMIIQTCQLCFRPLPSLRGSIRAQKKKPMQSSEAQRSDNKFKCLGF